MEASFMLGDYIIRLSESIIANPARAMQWKKDLLMLINTNEILTKLAIETESAVSRAMLLEQIILEQKELLNELKKELDTLKKIDNEK